MNRDCGKGKLIPSRYTIKYCQGKADREISKPATSPNDPLFEEIAQSLAPFGDVRLYACDKAGYCNCIRSARCNPAGQLNYTTDRRNELTGAES